MNNEAFFQAYVTCSLWASSEEIDGKEVNRQLVEKGLACVLYIDPGGKARIAGISMGRSSRVTA